MDLVILLEYGGKENTIVEGHGRYFAAKKLGYKEVPIIRLDHLSDEERKAYGLAHNKTAEISIWETETLEEELDEHYCDVIIQRWENLTGKKAELIEN